jgi:hypothetical protein
VDRSSIGYSIRLPDDSAVRVRLREIAAVRRRFRLYAEERLKFAVAAVANERSAPGCRCLCYRA